MEVDPLEVNIEVDPPEVNTDGPAGVLPSPGSEHGSGPPLDRPAGVPPPPDRPHISHASTDKWAVFL